MKILNKSLIAMGICLSFGAHAADDRYIIQVDSANKGVVKNLAKKLGADINIEGQEFFAATFTGKDLATVKGLLNNPHIQLIEEDAKRKLLSYSDDIGDAREKQLTPYAVYQSQADQLNLQPNDFIKVCVIDSGLDRSNSDFDWTNITGDNDSGTGNWDENGGPHGTHVAGTIGAADNGYGIIGMAPGVPMHIVKVFNADGWGYSSDLAYAAEKCTDAGANIINMSLGGGAPTTAEENAFKAFTNNGGLVLAAAGNDGNDVLSYPAGYQSVMMVGANDNNDQIAAFSQFPECTIVYSGKKGKNNQEIIDSTCVEVTAGGVNTLSTYPADMASTSVVTVGEQVIASSGMTYSSQGYASGAVHYMGLGDAVDTQANGKICLIDRGVISFDEKVMNCEGSGGLGAVIVNNVDGMLNGTLGETTTSSIPAVGVALSDRNLLQSASNVAIEIDSSDYGLMSGTSMATPGVAGMAALLWSNHQTCTGTQIRDALKQTAFDAGATGRDNYFGYGIVKIADAHEYLLANGCDEQTAGFIELATSTSTGKKGYNVNLEWVNATARKVDVYRNGTIISTTSNDGSYTDTLASNAYGMYSYQVCDQSSGNCSSISSVTFD
ncbi:COG1404 Subtilisin-like serine proteases [Vibrio sp. B1FLJ16]|uniref:S8 family serine peptidase n=1 Tax=Vibrio sp. B1FLJ16 TaxID=2751178 RepID=UPI0015F527A0|nr:S8 family serine peptidase [Vibrio sp. B1FLJ16]CAD7800322.1 COG1404 Subtilisin-like serine proteases [Vibrio sp. B1FLJ16]CAE6887460.1 COG1404 Subtilisin-like serine proteases [Vibrio sp. B1FLJ16]